MKKIFALLAVIAFSTTACAMLNPASIYCDTLGYSYFVVSTDEGDIGFCSIVKDNVNYSVDSWKFLVGEAGQQYSYCAKQNYSMRTVENKEKCSNIYSDKCMVCLVDGKETEVTQLMGLTFEETKCGDGHCGFPENYVNCPQDCPPGGIDGYCDGISDGTCDQDCVALEDSAADPDCKTEQSWTTYLVIALIAIIALMLTLAIFIFLIKKLKSSKKE
jgi:putative hemolysin